MGGKGRGDGREGERRWEGRGEVMGGKGRGGTHLAYHCIADTWLT